MTTSGADTAEHPEPHGFIRTTTVQSPTPPLSQDVVVVVVVVVIVVEGEGTRCSNTGDNVVYRVQSVGQFGRPIY